MSDQTNMQPALMEKILNYIYFQVMIFSAQKQQISLYLKQCLGYEEKGIKWAKSLWSRWRHKTTVNAKGLYKLGAATVYWIV